ncbi:MAG: hypothetical protein Q8N00_14515 [Nitrospirota bacterium]|nr:hypothetical protein [Nitrospirota bacterium]MDP3596093.1 hypothetical protein [Nitrospirota bacterium]
MRSIINPQLFSSCAKTGVLGLALIGLASCSSGDSPTGTVTTGGSAALQGPLVFVNNTGDRTLSTLALRGDSGSSVINTLGPTVFGNVALGDMQFSLGEWVFVNLAATNQVATIDPLTGATPVHEVNLTAGTRPVHIYRDPTDQEVMWVMNDGDNAIGTITPGDDLINCAAQGGGSVTIIHNSHLGPGATPPTVERTVCVLADGHKVTAFSQPTAADTTIPRRAFVSSSTAGEIAVIDNTPIPGLDPNWRLINRIDLCDGVKESTRPTPATCNVEDATLNTAFTTNNSNPHGIRWSKLTGKVYSIQENYRTIVEIDPTTLAVTLVADLSATNYTAFGISPDGRFLLLRGSSAAPFGTRLGVIDLAIAGNPRAISDLTIPELDGAGPGAFKFSPDGRRFYIVASNTSTTKKDHLFAFNASDLTANPPALTLLRDVGLISTVNGAHSFDVLAQPPTGSPTGTLAEARYLVVSNGTDNSVSVINATDNQIKQTVTVGTTPGSVMVYFPGSAAGGHQAISSVTGGASSSVAVLPELLDDHGMPE